jgi:hypothetical protein
MDGEEEGEEMEYKEEEDIQREQQKKKIQRVLV